MKAEMVIMSIYAAANCIGDTYWCLVFPEATELGCHLLLPAQVATCYLSDTSFERVAVHYDQPDLNTGVACSIGLGEMKFLPYACDLNCSNPQQHKNAHHYLRNM